MPLMSAEFGRGLPAQAVAPSSVLADQIGAGTRAAHAVSNGASAESDVAPRDGIVLVFIPPNATGVAGTDAARVVVGAGVTAVVTDMIYPGPWVYPFPIKRGERVSIFADGVNLACTIVMARGDV